MKGGGNERGAMSRACQTIEGSTGEKKKQDCTYYIWKKVNGINMV